MLKWTVLGTLRLRLTLTSSEENLCFIVGKKKELPFTLEADSECLAPKSSMKSTWGTAVL